MTSLTTAAPAVGAAFIASLVEVVEAFTIVLAAATLRGWRAAIAGTAAGLGVLASIVVALGPLLDQVPLHLLQLVIGSRCGLPAPAAGTRTKRCPSTSPSRSTTAGRAGT